MTTIIPTDALIKITNDEAVSYKVTQSPIDLKQLRAERKALRELIKEEEPSEETLITIGKGAYPQIYDSRYRKDVKKRIDKITEILTELAADGDNDK